MSHRAGVPTTPGVALSPIAYWPHLCELQPSHMVLSLTFLHDPFSPASSMLPNEHCVGDLHSTKFGKRCRLSLSRPQFVFWTWGNTSQEVFSNELQITKNHRLSIKMYHLERPDRVFFFLPLKPYKSGLLHVNFSQCSSIASPLCFEHSMASPT